MPYGQYSTLADVLLLNFIHISGTVHTGGKDERFKFWPDFSVLLGAGLLEELCSFSLTMLRLLHFFLVGLLLCATELFSHTGASSGAVLGRRGGKKKLDHSPLTPTRGGGGVMGKAPWWCSRIPWDGSHGKGSVGWHCRLGGSHLLQLLNMQSISAHCWGDSKGKRTPMPSCFLLSARSACCRVLSSLPRICLESQQIFIQLLQSYVPSAWSLSGWEWLHSSCTGLRAQQRRARFPQDAVLV